MAKRIMTWDEAKRKVKVLGFNEDALQRFNIWLGVHDRKRLGDVAKKMTAGTKTSQLIRQAIAEYLEREEKK